MLATSPTINCPPRFHERRQHPRIAEDRNARLLVRGVEGFVLDASETGARVVVWATDAFDQATVLLSVDGEAAPRLGAVQWAERHPDGSILGIEFISAAGELDQEAEAVAEEEFVLDIEIDLDWEVAAVLDHDTALLSVPDTQIRPIPIHHVSDDSAVVTHHIRLVG